MVSRIWKRKIMEKPLEKLREPPVYWHHRLYGHDFEQTPGDSEGQEAWCAAVHGVAKSQA